MKYMLLIYGDPSADAPPTAPEGAYPDWMQATEALRADGVLEGGAGLQPTDAATTVRSRGGDRLVADGPFAETKEHLLGYYLVDVPDIDTALSYAGRMPSIGWGSVEVRPVMETPANA